MTRLGDRRTAGAALHDPVRSSGGLHEKSRLSRGIAEFLRLPLLMTLCFTAAGVGLGVLDLSAGPDAPLRGLAEAVVPGGGASDFLSAAATSVVTITSITFSVLLLAVQQTASSLTPVVFDQFLRRTANQVYFGVFVGVSVFSLVVLGMARPDPGPVYGAAVTLVLVVAALVVLLLLIHGTIDQMRPQSVLRSIHELALRGRERELVLLGRTRAERRSDPAAPERLVRVLDTGYVTSLDLDRLAAVAAEIGDGAEILVEGTLGVFLMYDDPVVRLVGVHPDDDSHDDAVLAAVGMDDIRDVDQESGYSIEQLENIAWAVGSSGQQSPQTAVQTVRTLRDLLARWLMAGERDRSVRAEKEAELPIVYADGAVPHLLDTLSTVLVAAAESRQAATCAEALHAFADLAPRLQSPEDVARFKEALDVSLPGVLVHAEVPRLSRALERLEQVLRENSQDASRVSEVRFLLSEATRRLLPKPSDEPDSAHPR